MHESQCTHASEKDSYRTSVFVRGERAFGAGSISNKKTF